MKRIHSLLVFAAIIYLFLSILSSGETAGQDRACYYCKKEIKGSYLFVDGRYYHPEHFLCSKCGKPISGSFQEIEGKYYHYDCGAVESGLICAVCNKVITGEYTTVAGKNYHPECYKNNIVPKCSICLEPLIGKYQIDIYGNKFHSRHSSELSKCDNCGRLICAQLTEGGISYGDGRHICNICYRKAIFTEGDINTILSKVKNKLTALGLDLKDVNASIQGVNLNELKRISGADTFSELEGYCNSESSSDMVNGKEQKKTFTHKIYVLNGIPAINLEGIIAHELMHAWTFQNTRNTMSADVSEGSCNYMSYLYLQNTYDPEVQYILKRMEQNPDPMYGKGYLKIKGQYGGKALSTLLEYLKKM